MSSFMSGQTSFTETQVDITPADMPSLTFCFVTKADVTILLLPGSEVGKEDGE